MAERTSTAIVVVIALLLLVGLLFLVPMLGMWMWWPMMGGGMMGQWGYPVRAGWGLMFVGALIPLFFIVLVVIGTYFLLTPKKQPAVTDQATAILNERYAKGEISKEQYIEMKDQLTKK